MDKPYVLIDKAGKELYTYLEGAEEGELSEVCGKALQSANDNNMALDKLLLEDDAFVNVNLFGLRAIESFVKGCRFYDCKLGESTLCYSVFERCDFQGVDFTRADLDCVVFMDCIIDEDCKFAGASIDGVNLLYSSVGCRWLDGGMRTSGGYRFFLTDFGDEGLRIKAGCRNFTLEKAREHWDGDEESVLIVNTLLKRAAYLEWPSVLDIRP